MVATSISWSVPESAPLLTLVLVLCDVIWGPPTRFVNPLVREESSTYESMSSHYRFIYFVVQTYLGIQISHDYCHLIFALF